ncbi:MAG: MFS transporter [Candidatus Aenigmatarchaeota archaeon]
MLNSFNIGLPMYAVVTSVSVIATILSQPYWGKFADKFGDRTTMAICSVLIALVPGLWLLVQNPMQMMLVYIGSGFAWAGFDLAVFNYLLDSTPENKRSSYIANYTTFVGLASFLGPLAGGMLAVFAQGSMLIGSGLGLVFAMSFVLRLATAGVLIPHLRELRAKRVPHMNVIFWRAVTVYPLRFFAQEIAIAPHWLHHRLSTKRLM